MKTKIFCFDMDNVICKTKKNKYKNSIPIKQNIKIINSLFEKGYIIKIFTARFMGTFKDNSNLATKAAKNVTKKQLKKWNVKYHKNFFLVNHHMICSLMIKTITLIKIGN